MERVYYYLVKSNASSRHSSIPFHGWLQITKHTDLLSFSATDLLHYIMLNVEHEKIF